MRTKYNGSEFYTYTTEITIPMSLFIKLFELGTILLYKEEEKQIEKYNFSFGGDLFLFIRVI